MTSSFDRRTFTKVLALGLAGTAVPLLNAQKARRLVVGHTGITWGYNPADAEKAITDAGSLGFRGYESFGSVLEAWEAKGGLDKVLEAAKLPLRSAYCPVNLTDPTKRKAEVTTIVRWGRLIKKCGGSVAVIGPNGVKPSEFTFADHKKDIVEALNDIGKALTDIGIVGAIHPHTGTSIGTRDEIYAVMEAVDTRYVKFGPDVGQIQKSGSDPVKVVKDLLSTVRHLHIKDFLGGPHYEGYCPLGQGHVDLAAICDLVESSGNDLMIMCELEPTKDMPLTPLEAARINKQTMEKLGYVFRA